VDHADEERLSGRNGDVATGGRSWRRGGSWCRHGSSRRRSRSWDCARGVTRKGQSDYVIGAKGLNFAVHFKTKDGLGATEIPPLDHFAAFEFQGVCGSGAHGEQRKGNRRQVSIYVTHNSLSRSNSLIRQSARTVDRSPTARRMTILLLPSIG